MLREALIDEIRSLPVEDRKQLIKLIVDTLTESPLVRTRRLLEFEGIGQRLRDDGVAAQDYVNQLRSERDIDPKISL